MPRKIRDAAIFITVFFYLKIVKSGQIWIPVNIKKIVYLFPSINDRFRRYSTYTEACLAICNLLIKDLPLSSTIITPIFPLFKNSIKEISALIENLYKSDDVIAFTGHLEYL